MKQRFLQSHVGVPARHTAATTPLVGETEFKVRVDRRFANESRRIDHRPASESRYVRLPELCTLVPFSVATIWRKSKDGSFPSPVKLSARISAWNRAEVMEFLAQKEAA